MTAIIYIIFSRYIYAGKILNYVSNNSSLFLFCIYHFRFYSILTHSFVYMIRKNDNAEDLDKTSFLANFQISNYFILKFMLSVYTKYIIIAYTLHETYLIALEFALNSGHTHLIAQ